MCRLPPPARLENPADALALSILARRSEVGDCGEEDSLEGFAGFGALTTPCTPSCSESEWMVSRGA